MDKRGLFIVVEGPDGSGKTTVVKELKAALEKKNLKVITTSEPTNSDTGKEIRRILSSNNKEEQSKLLDLFVKDREEHIENFILPSLDYYDVVITDRYMHSTLVYQYIQGLSSISEILDKHEGLLQPDFTFILFDSIDSLIKRIGGRGNKEFLEKEDIILKSIDIYMQMHNILKSNQRHIRYIYNHSLDNTVNTISKEIELISILNKLTNGLKYVKGDSK